MRELVLKALQLNLMAKSAIFILVLLYFCLFNLGVSFAAQDAASKDLSNQIKIVDDSGYELILEKPAKRVLGLYGAFNELMLALGLKDLLVGRTAADKDIEGLKHLPAVGTHMRPNIELILGLKPDVVIQFMGREEAKSLALGLRGHNVPVLMFNMETFEDMFRVIEKLGQATGHIKEAQALVTRYKKRLANLHSILLDEKRVRVFYEVRYPNLLAAGPESIVSSIIHIAGGSNVITLSGRVLRINEEELVDKRPDAYIIQQGPMNPDPMPIKERPHFATLPAVQNGRVLVVDQLSFARPGPKAIDAAEMLARWLHPTVNFDIKLD